MKKLTGIFSFFGSNKSAEQGLNKTFLNTVKDISDENVKAYVKGIQALVEKNDAVMLIEHLQTKVPLQKVSNNIEKILLMKSVINACEEYMKYAASQGYADVVNVFKRIELTPKFVQYQGPSPKSISEAEKQLNSIKTSLER
tara:strand:- start:850 stop:1275 length:426 start_codon:yes stop_codon:yes gene_type:complete